MYWYAEKGNDYGKYVKQSSELYGAFKHHQNNMRQVEARDKYIDETKSVELDPLLRNA